MAVKPGAILSRRRPWVHHLAQAQADAVILEATAMDALVVRLDGRRMRTVNDLFKEYVREFQFPEYFGWNWDAFDECMSELESVPARVYLTVIQHADEVLAEAPEALPVLLRQLENFGAHWGNAFALDAAWGGGEVPFNTIMVVSHPLSS